MKHKQKYDIGNHNNIPLRTDDSKRYDHLRQESQRREASRDARIDAQHYIDAIREKRSEYTSSMHNIRANLKAASNGLEEIDQKGTMDSISSAIDKVCSLREKQLGISDAYLDALVKLDVSRAAELRKTLDPRAQIVLGQFDAKVSAAAEAYQKKMTQLKKLQAEAEQDLESADINPDDILTRKKQVNDIMQKEQNATDKYIKSLEGIMSSQDETLNANSSRFKPSVSDTQDYDAEDDVRMPLTGDVDTDDDAFGNAFSSAHEKSSGAWHKFISLPVIRNIAAGSAVVGHGVQHKFTDFASDIRMGYAAMKEHRHTRRAERELSQIDPSMADDFRDFLLKKKQGLPVAVKDEQHEVMPDAEVSVPLPEVNGNDAAKDEDSSAARPSSDSPAEEKPDASEPVKTESLHDIRVRNAGNMAAMATAKENGLLDLVNASRRILAQSDDTVTDIAMSGDVPTDLARAVDQLRYIANATLTDDAQKKAADDRLSQMMSEVYNSKSASEQRVSDAEALLEKIDSSDAPAEAEAKMS